MTDRPRRRLTIRGMLLAILLIGLGLAVAIQSFRAEQLLVRQTELAQQAQALQTQLVAVQTARQIAPAGPGNPVGGASVPELPGPEGAALQRRILELEAEVAALRRQLNGRPQTP